MNQLSCEICKKVVPKLHGKQKYCDTCQSIGHRLTKKKHEKERVKRRNAASPKKLKDTPRHEQMREYARENKEELRRRSREYYQKHKHIWKKKYKKKSFRQRIIEAFIEKQYPVFCEACGYKNQDILVPHHLLPISQGGTNELDNILLLCPNCHSLIEHPKYTNQIQDKLFKYEI